MILLEIVGNGLKRRSATLAELIEEAVMIAIALPIQLLAATTPTIPPAPSSSPHGSRPTLILQQ